MVEASPLLEAPSLSLETRSVHQTLSSRSECASQSLCIAAGAHGEGTEGGGGEG